VPAARHPDFEQPDDLDVKIWRYMDFSKYVRLLSTKSLFFPSAKTLADPLIDPFEGALTQAGTFLTHYHKLVR